ASRKQSWLLAASAQRSSQRATSCSQPCLSTWIHRHASSRKKSSVQSLPLPHSIPTKKHLSWQTTPSTAWLPTSGLLTSSPPTTSRKPLKPPCLVELQQRP